MNLVGEARMVEDTSDAYKRHSHLDWLESEAVHILREVAGECRSPALLFSGGKDSAVVLRLAEKAFRPGPIPFPVLHIDTGHNFPEAIEFRDARVAELGVRLIVGSVEDSMRRGSVKLRRPDESRNVAQSITLLEAIAAHKLDACIGGARRDEEKARAKERVFSFRDEFGQWDPKNQRPELWSLYNPRVHPGRTRAGLSDQQLDRTGCLAVHRARAHEPARRCISPIGAPSCVATVCWWRPRRSPHPRPGEVVEEIKVRFRTVGDMTCTCPVESNADTVAAIVAETAGARITERGATRMDDQTSDASMERRKKEGYF